MPEAVSAGRYGVKRSSQAPAGKTALTVLSRGTRRGRGVVSAKEEGRREMKSLLTVLTLAVVMWVPGKLSAQGKVVVLVETIQDVPLSDEQETKFADIRKEYQPKIQKAAKELGTLVKAEVGKVRAVLTPEQKEKLKDLKEERKQRRAEGLAHRIAHLHELDLTEAEQTKIMAIRKEFRPKVVKAMEGLKDILSDEQRKAREEGLKGGKKRKEVIASLKLTDAQKDKVEAIAKKVGALVREELEKIRDVLTETQKEKLQEFKAERREHVRDREAHRIAHLKDLNLTDEQVTKITEIRQEYRPKVQEAGNKLRAAIREEVHKIIAVLNE
jgi:Spy/CpxP family protein refolding chaperone